MSCEEIHQTLLGALLLLGYAVAVIVALVVVLYIWVGIGWLAQWPLIWIGLL